MKGTFEKSSVVPFLCCDIKEFFFCFETTACVASLPVEQYGYFLTTAMSPLKM